MKRPVIAMILIALGCAALVGAMATGIYTRQFTRTAQRAPGTVVEMRQQTDNDSGNVTYAPVFRFQDTAGAEHTVESSFYSSPPGFHVGDSVTVLYRRDNPKKARIDSFWQVWGLPSFLGIIGSVELPVGLIVLFWPKMTGRFKGQPDPAQAT